MAKFLLFVCCLSLLQWLTQSLSLNERHSSSRVIAYYSHVTFADRTDSFEENGLVASYSNKTVAQVTGLFYHPGNAFTSFYCLSKKRSPVYPPRNYTLPPRQPFIILLPLSTSCDHYSLSKIAANLGARGVVFYGTSSTGGSITSYHGTKLTVVVAYVQLSDNEVAAYKDILNIANTTITIAIRQINSAYRTSQTFYFVVFAFTVLVLLSLVWFVITYVRRCHSYCSRRYTRRRERQATTRAITSLPTKKYKITKSKNDTDSVNSLEEPTCAVCLEIFRQNEIIRPLPCGHEFHKVCIDPWLLTRGNCPLCKSSIIKRETSSRVSSSHTMSHNSRVVPVRTDSTNTETELLAVALQQSGEEEDGNDAAVLNMPPQSEDPQQTNEEEQPLTESINSSIV